METDATSGESKPAAPMARRSSGVTFTSPLTVVLFGATGDLAKKKLFPSLYQLIYGCPDAPLLPESTKIIGYGRSAVDMTAFLEKQCANVKGPRKEEFLKQISYFKGAYDSEEDFGRLNDAMKELEGGLDFGNRLFFLSVPPTVFGSVCEMIHSRACSKLGFTRLIIEKPFGRDSRTFAELNNTTSRLFREEQLFRIDHYLAKELVLNMVALRFANQLYEPLWNRHHISHVEVIFKEDIGTGGRGGYFDEFGIIRDIMQNHLLQVILWIAMEPPKELDADNITAAKCQLLKATRTLEMKDCFLGQFTANTVEKNGETVNEPGYLDDPTVPAGSRCPTYAATVIKIDNDRWNGVPFLMRAGKGMNERVTEVRITFKKKPYNKLVPCPANELVMRIQPDAEISFNCMNKAPGWSQDSVEPVKLDMSYSQAFPDSYVADAYERMILNAAKGDRSLFVSSGELVESWRIFTPLLDEIDSTNPQPVLYPFGSENPDGFDAFVASHKVGDRVDEDMLKKPVLMMSGKNGYAAGKENEPNELMDAVARLVEARKPKTAFVAMSKRSDWAKSDVSDR